RGVDPGLVGGRTYPVAVEVVEVRSEDALVEPETLGAVDVELLVDLDQFALDTVHPDRSTGRAAVGDRQGRVLYVLTDAFGDLPGHCKGRVGGQVVEGFLQQGSCGHRFGGFGFGFLLVASAWAQVTQVDRTSGQPERDARAGGGEHPAPTTATLAVTDRRHPASCPRSPGHCTTTREYGRGVGDEGTSHRDPPSLPWDAGTRLWVFPTCALGGESCPRGGFSGSCADAFRPAVASAPPKKGTEQK